MDSTPAVTHIGLCAGYGGIELGLHRAIGNMRTVALCEIEAFAIANLVSKMEAGLMDPAPIWPDLKTFPWAAFRDRVDILTGGYPCQPFSAAGQRKGKQDPRHLWPFIADGIQLLRPRCCFFENVEGHISLGLSDVIEDLAGMGYRTTWGLFSAAEVGAPHQRKRVFILAYRDGERGQLPAWWRLAAEPLPVGHGKAGRDELADAGSTGPQGQRGECGHGEGGSEVEAGGRCRNPWPSRPGEQQYWWEPPRVVSGRQALDDTQERCLRDDSDNQRQAAGEGDTANDSGSCSGEAVADGHRIDRSAQAEGREHDRQARSAGEELGNATSTGSRSEGGYIVHQERRSCISGTTSIPENTQRENGAAIPDNQSTGGDGGEELADTSIIGSDGRPDGISWGSREPGEAGEDAAGCGGESNGMRQTQPPLGRDADGAAGGMDYAELCVSGDNRTDELRLLGNGVVPATAERAFRVLMKELYTAPAVS